MDRVLVARIFALHKSGCFVKLADKIDDYWDMALDLKEILIRIISFQTFSSIWYWLAICVIWVMVCYRTIGVPLDMIHRARRHGGQAAADLEAAIAINLRRLNMFSQLERVVYVSVAAFVVSAIVVSAVYYDLEFAKGLIIIVFSLLISFSVNIYGAMRLATQPRHGSSLVTYLLNIRLLLQFIGATTVFVTFVFGMKFNLLVYFGQ